MGIVALILGISTLVFSGLGCIPAMWWFSYVAIGTGIAGIVISAIGMIRIPVEALEAFLGERRILPPATRKPAPAADWHISRRR